MVELQKQSCRMCFAFPFCFINVLHLFALVPQRNLPEHVHDISAVFCVRPSFSTPPLPMRRAREAEQGEAFEQLNAAVPRWVVWQIPRKPMLNAYRSSTVQVCSVRRSSSPNSWLNLGKISVQGERAKFTGLVLGCIEAKFCK